MAIADFPTLRTTVQSYCARSDTKFVNMVETFVAFAEERIFNGAGKKGEPLFSAPLRVKDMEKIATLALTNGESGLPTRCVLVRSVTVTGLQTPVVYLAPDKFREVQNVGISGDPQCYTVDNDTLRILPATTATVDVVYFERPAALTVDAPTHPILVAHPMVYLSMVLFEAFTWMQEQEAAVAHLARGKALIDGVNRTAFENRILSGAMTPNFQPIG